MENLAKWNWLPILAAPALATLILMAGCSTVATQRTQAPLTTAIDARPVVAAAV